MAQNYYIKVKSCETAPNAEPEYWSQQTVSATQKNLFYNQGSIGVGVPNPLAKLQVDGSVGIGTAFATTAPPLDGCIISGNVGIGVATPAHKLHVIGNARIEGNLIVNGSQTIIDTDVQTTERLDITNNGTGPALRVNQVGTNDVIDILDSGVSVLKIKDGGNVGIGTDNPQAKLHVNGAFYCPGAVVQMKYLNHDSATTTVITSSVPYGQSTPLVVSITPKFSNSLLLVDIRAQLQMNGGGSGNGAVLYIRRDNLTMEVGNYNGGCLFFMNGTENMNTSFPISRTYVANSTTTTEFRLYIRNFSSTGSVTLNSTGISTITVMEIAQ